VPSYSNKTYTEIGVASVCDSCGCLVYNEPLHDQWHSAVLHAMQVVIGHEEVIRLLFDPDDDE
jgi:hypothetical protein